MTTWIALNGNACIVRSPVILKTCDAITAGGTVVATREAYPDVATSKSRGRVVLISSSTFTLQAIEILTPLPTNG